jgi:hypothetical protein
MFVEVKDSMTGVFTLSALEIYTTPTCDYCLSAKALFAKKGVT